MIFMPYGFNINTVKRIIVVCVWCHISSKYTNIRAWFEDKQTAISSSNHEVPEL